MRKLNNDIPRKWWVMRRTRLSVWVCCMGLLCGPLVDAGRPAQASPSNEKFVIYLFDDLLHRSPTSGELLSHTALLDAGYPVPSYVGAFFQSSPFRDAWISSLYATYMGRSPSASERTTLESWIAGTGYHYTSSEAVVLSSSAYYSLVGGTDDAFVRALYNDVLSRDASSYELAADLTALSSMTKTRSQLSVDLITSPESAEIRSGGFPGETDCISMGYESTDDTSSGAFCIFMKRLPSSAELNTWIQQLGVGSHLPSLWADIAASGEYWSLTQD